MPVKLNTTPKLALTGGRLSLLAASATVVGSIAFGPFNLLSYPLTATTAANIFVTGNYTGDAPASPSATWSSGDTATVSNWTAANGQWSCRVSTPATNTGNLALTIGSQVSQPIAVTAGVYDLAPGFHCSPTLVYGPNGNTNVPIGGYILRGFLGTPTITISDTVPGSGDGAAFYIDTIGKNIVATWGSYNNLTQATFAITITATDGVFTSSQEVTVVNAPNNTPYFTESGNIIYDTYGPVNSYNNPSHDNQTSFDGGAYPGTTQLFNGVTSLTVDDPTGVVQWETDGYFYTATTNITKYGAYPVTITINGTYTFDYTFFIVHETEPTVGWTPALNVFDNTPAQTVIGNMGYCSDANFGQMVLQPTLSPTAPIVYIGVYGQVMLAAPVSAGALSLTFSIQGTGNPTLMLVIVPIGAGVTLPSSNFSWTALPNPLDNSMARPSVPAPGGFAPAVPLLLTTMAVTGFTNTPTWSIAVLTSAGLPDTAQMDDPWIDAYGCPPRYTFNAPLYTEPNSRGATAQKTITGTSGIPLYASHLSAQTDNVYITADDGQGTRCTVMIPVTVTAKVGPSIDVGPNVTPVAGQAYLTANALLADWYANHAAFDGAVVTLQPGINAATDFTFSAANTASGYLNGWWPGPVTLQSPPGTVRTLLDWNHGWNGSGPSAGLVGGPFDMTLINLEVRGVTLAGASGGPNAGGLYMTGGEPGNMTIDGCYVYNCDMGLMDGDGSTRHVLVTNSIFQRCGTSDGAGTDHNIYVSSAASLTMRNCQSDQATDDHVLKCRARVTIVDSCFFRQGAQTSGAGSPVELPLGGYIRFTNNLFLTCGNPGNPNQLEIADENAPQLPNQGAGTLWPQTQVVISGNTFLNISAPMAIDSGNGAALGLSVWPKITPLTGIPTQVTYSNNKFYNLLNVNWTNPGLGSGFAAYYNMNNEAGSNYIDGGGNVALTTYPPQSVIDPLTGVRPVNQPMVALGYASPPCMFTSDSLLLNFIVPENAPAGTVIATMIPTDWGGDVLTSPTFSLPTNPGNYFAFDPEQGIVTTAVADIPDGLYQLEIHCVGTNSSSATVTLDQWMPVIVGTGYVAAS